MRILHELEGKIAVGGKGILLQNPLHPGMDGVDGGLIHTLRRPFQTLGELRPGTLCILAAQGLQKGVGALHAPGKKLSRLVEALTDAGAQLHRCRIGEGHHQQFFGQIGARAAMAEHQTEVQGSDGIGFPRPGTGLDEATPGSERKVQGIENRRLAHQPKASFPWVKHSTRGMARVW